MAEAESVVTWSARDTDVPAIERALASLARRRALTAHGEVAAAGGPAPADNQQVEHPPARSRVQNLICVADDDEAAHAAVRVIGRLSGVHPSRALVLVADAAGADGIDARLAVHAHTRHDFHLSDVLVVTCRGGAAGHLAAVADPLLLPDLPTILWFPGDCGIEARAGSGRGRRGGGRRPPAGGASPLDHLLELADRLAVDSAAFGPAPQHRLRTLARLAAGGGPPVLSDLNWRRLLPWRVGLARLFDRPAARRWLGALDAVQALTPEAGAAGGMLLAGWLSARLGRRLRRVAGGEPGVELRAGHAASFALRPHGGRAELSWTVDGVRSTETLRLPAAGEADLLAAELASAADPSLAEALASPRRLRPEAG